MTPDEMRALYRRFVDEVINQGKYEAGDELLAEDFVDHTPLLGLPGNRTGYVETFRGFRRAFPDMNVTIDDLVAEGDTVAGRGTVRGANTGPMASPMGEIPPTGKSATWTYINIVRIRGGKAVETWSQQDVPTMMQQLGLMPSSAGAPA